MHILFAQINKKGGVKSRLFKGIISEYFTCVIKWLPDVISMDLLLIASSDYLLLHCLPLDTHTHFQKLIPHAVTDDISPCFPALKVMTGSV